MKDNESAFLNCCIFSGVLSTSKTWKGDSEYGEWNLFKGKLIIPGFKPEKDQDNTSLHYQGQTIELVAWNHKAKLLTELPKGTKIKVMTCYNPGEFKGKLMDTFEVDSFVLL